MAKFPNFLIIGAAKSGTYTLHTHFARHPEVFMCARKEPHYFSFGASAEVDSARRGPVHSCVSSQQAYRELFAERRGAKMCGESSVSYLYVPGTAERIFEYNPEMKLIVSLRNPVARAYSSFNSAKSYGLEPLRTLAEGLEAEQRRIQEDCSILLRYRDLGRYSRHLARFYNVFPQGQIKVIIYEEFVQNPAQVIRQLCEFIGVSTEFEPDPKLHSNATKRPDDKNLLHNFINGQHPARSVVRKLLPLKARIRLREFAREFLFKPPPSMGVDERSRFKHLFDDDIQELQKQLGRDLSVWWD